jgi:hypothetical protein
MIHSPQDLYFFATDGIVPGKKSELPERWLQMCDAYSQMLDAETALNNPIKQQRNLFI